MKYRQTIRSTPVIPIRILAAVLIMIWQLSLLTACSSPDNTTGGQTAASTTRGPALTALAYLQQVKASFKPIDELLADKELDLLGDAQDQGEAPTEAQLAHYSELLKGYQVDLTAARRNLAGLNVPKQPDLEQCNKAQLAQLDVASSIVDEYQSVLSYTDGLFTVSSYLDALGNTSTEDLEAIYQAFNTNLTAAIKILKDNPVPSFLENTNANLIANLEEMNAAVLYMLQAFSLNDPLRTDAATYRMDMLTRRLDATMSGIEKDMTEREAKLKEELENIQTKQKQLRTWVDDNMQTLR